MLEQSSINLNDYVQIKKEQVDAIEKQFWNIERDFKFDYAANRTASNNYTILNKKGDIVGGVPILYEYWMKSNRIMLFEELHNMALEMKWKADGHEEYSLDAKAALRCKLRNLWTGWLREIHARIFLQKYDLYGTFWYADNIDLKHGIDIFYRRAIDHRLFGIAVRHDGAHSDYFDNKRKIGKRSDWVLTLTSSPNKANPSGLDVVKPKTIFNLVCGMLSFEFDKHFALAV